MQGGDHLSLRPRRDAAAPRPPVLVPVVRGCHGHGLASSEITTSVIGALKRGLASSAKEFGLHVCGGRGKYSRQTSHELVAIGDRVGFDGSALATASCLIAKVARAAVRDGFQLYLRSFIVTDNGHWVVVQQGMDGALKQARRYWLFGRAGSFVEEPHTVIAGLRQGEIINLTDQRAEASRCKQLEILSSLGPDGSARELSALEARHASSSSALREHPLLPHLEMPAHHGVRPSDVIARRLYGNLAAAADRGPTRFPRTAAHPRRRTANRPGARHSG